MKKVVSLLMIAMMLFCGGFALTSCSSSSSDSTSLEEYDYNSDGEMQDNEFQDAVGDYMDENGY